MAAAHYKLTSIAAFFALAVGASAENLLLNGSFEDPVIGNTGLFQPSNGGVIGSGWVADTGQSVLLGKDFDGGPGGGFWPGATDGNQYLYLGIAANAGAIHQDFSLPSAGSYALTFDLANFLVNWNGNGAQVSVDVVDLGNSTSVLGGPETFSRPAAGGYVSEEIPFSSSGAGNYRITVASAQGYGSNVDNFSLVALPEPGVCALVTGLGLAGFAVLRRRL